MSPPKLRGKMEAAAGANGHGSQPTIQTSPPSCQSQSVIPYTGFLKKKKKAFGLSGFSCFNNCLKDTGTIKEVELQSW